MIRHDGWSHNDLRVNLVVMHYFVSYRDSNIIWCIDKVVAIFAKVITDVNVEDEEIQDFSVRKGYTIPCYYELSEILSLLVHPF